MDIQGDLPITLVIKAPNQRVEDHTVDCMPEWTIRKLKHHLETVYPSKPKHHEQRLIYSGKLLQDDLTLKEILKSYDADDDSSNTHTVHLVCSKSSSSSSPTKPETTSSPTTSSSGATDQSASPTVFGQDGLRQRTSAASNHSTVQQPTTPTQFSNYPEGHAPSTPVTPLFDPSSMPGGIPPGCPYTPEQYAWMMQQQEAYSQYMMQYMQYYQSVYNPGQSNPYTYMGDGQFNAYNPYNFQIPTPVGPQHNPLQQNNTVPGAAAQPVGNNADQQQQPPPPQPAAAAANNNVRLNAQGGVDEDDDEGEQRDWLHRTYFFMRLATFVGILVFYSSFSRFTIVMVGFLVIYLLQKLRIARQNVNRAREAEALRRQQEEAEQQAQQEQQQQPQTEQQGEGEKQGQEEEEQEKEDESNAQSTSEETSAVETDSRASEGNESNQQQREQTGEENQEENRMFRVIWFIVATVEAFFTSLVPAPPELMEGN